jgi:toxin ParE1/3/4
MPRLSFSPKAEIDLFDIEEYIARDKPPAAEEWIERLKEKCRLIAEFPNAGERRDDIFPGFFCSVLGRYVIFYRHSEECVEILRIVTGDRDLGRIF